MAKDKKNKDNKSTADDTTSTDSVGKNYDDYSDPETNEEPKLPDETDDDVNEDEEFEFDSSLFLEGTELVDLAPDFIRPEGFLMVPRLNKKTGEIFPKSTTFAGILKDVISWKDGDKERFWFSCIATATIAGTQYTGRNEDKKPFMKPVQKGDCIGISCSGAINALQKKKGHFVLLHWTGAQKPMKKGQMWEVIAKISKDPVEKMPF